MNDTRNLQSLSTTMKSLCFHGAGNLRLDALVVPNPQAHEVRLRPLAAGLCGTDEHIFHGEFPAANPVVLGHEVAGVIEEVGSAVRGFKAGDLVSVQPNTYCKVCRFCRAGREHLCSNLQAYGVHLNGGFAQAMVASAEVLYRLPDGTDPRFGCLVEPLACCIHGMDRAAIRSGASVLVIGAGLIGLLLTRLSRLAGAGLIVVSEPQDLRRAKSLEFGADHAVNPKDAGDAHARAMTNGEGFDVVIDAVGSPGTFEQSIRMAGRGASVLVFGVAAQSAVASVRPFDIYARELTVLGSFINPYTHERAVSILPQMQMEKLPIRTFQLEEFKDAFEAHASSAVPAKVVLLPQG